MKRLLSMLLVVVMVMSLAMTAVYAEEATEEVTLPFTDVKDGKWFTDAVKYVYANGLMNGKEETKFAPNEVLTRAQFAKMLWSLAGEPATEANLDFADTKNTQWYAESLTWAVNSGIVNGYEEGGKKLFKPNKNIARDELAKMIVTFLQFMEVEIVGEEIADPFPDKIQNWAKEFVEAVRLSGLMKGKEGGAFAPKANATRAEGATIIMRMHPSLTRELTPTETMELMVEELLGNYQCATHDDITIVNNGGASHTNEAICAAIATVMNLDTDVYSITVSDGEVPNEGCGRTQYDYADLEFTITHIESGETVSFVTGVACYKYYNIGANDEDGTVRCFHADPIYVLPVGCPDDISSITEPKIAEAALATLPTEFAVADYTYEHIWKAINDALVYDAKMDFELVLNIAELDAIIAAVNKEDGTSSGKLTVKLERLTKGEVNASVEIDAKFTLKAVTEMQELADAFLDKYLCVTHSDVLYTHNYGSSIVKEDYEKVTAEAIGLDTDVYSFTFKEFTITNNYCNRGDGEFTEDNAPLVGVITHISTGLTYEFEYGAGSLKYYDSGAEYDEESGLDETKFFVAPVQILPEACPEDISSITTKTEAEALIAALPTELSVTEFTHKGIWTAINDALGLATDRYELVLKTSEINTLLEDDLSDFEATGTLTISVQRLGKATAKGEAAVELTFVHKTAMEMQEAIDAFLDSNKCVHGDYNFIHTWGSSLNPDAVLQAVSEAIGNPAKYYVTFDGDLNSCGYQAVKDAFGGVDRYQGAGGAIKFILNDIATGTKVPFEFKYQAQKHFSKIEQLDSGKDFDDTTWDDAYDSCGEGYTNALGIGVQPVYAPDYCSDLYGDMAVTKYMQGKFDESFADYKDENGTVVIPVADLASITAKNADAYKEVWFAIDAILEYDHPTYYMILTADTVHDLIANGGEGVLKIKLSPASGWVPQTKGQFQEINFKFVQAEA